MSDFNKSYKLKLKQPKNDNGFRDLTSQPLN